MATFRLTVEYDGRSFAGWQRQAGGERTVQATLEEALQRIAGERIPIIGAGRTDAGVHAEAQVASFRWEGSLPAPEKLVRAFNAHLPADVAVSAAAHAPSDFHACRDALAKTYCYRVWNNSQRSPLRAAVSLHMPQKLDLVAMQRAAEDLVGEHDFSSFRAAGSQVESSRRTLYGCIWRGETGGELRLWVQGSGFLRHMVRNIAGTLLEVGLSKRAADSMPALLQARDRSTAGPTAAAQALSLIRVHYQADEIWESAPIPGA